MSAPQSSTSKPLTVLQIIPSLESGGAEQSCIDVAAAIVNAGGVAYVATSGGRRIPEIIRAGGKIIQLPLRTKNPVTMWRNSKALEALIREHRIDIVHARSRAPAWSAYWATQKTDAHYMTTFHAAYKFASKLKQRYNSVMAKGERIIAISQFIAQYILDHYQVDPSRIRIIYRGTPLERFHPNMVHPERIIKLAREWQIPDDKLLILMPSRLTRIKGHHVLIEALSKMNRSDIFCIISGAEPGRDHYQQELTELIEHYKLSNVVRIVGPIIDVPAALRLAQVMVAPSLVPEGFGRMPVEAQAMGTPVVASAIGGHNEIIIDNETGWLVPPDDAQAMADAMNKALNLTDLERVNMATKAMSFVSTHFGKEQMTSQTLDVYRELQAIKKVR